MEIWRLATCGHGLHRFSLAYNYKTISACGNCLVGICPCECNWTWHIYVPLYSTTQNAIETATSS